MSDLDARVNLRKIWADPVFAFDATGSIEDLVDYWQRMVQAKRRLQVIEDRIAAERRKVGQDNADGTGRDFAELASEYERLAVEREFAEQSYVAALASYDAARAESQRTSRYLAAHVMPTRAEVSRYPERFWLLGLLAMALILLWSITALVAYSLKDRH